MPVGGAGGGGMPIPQGSSDTGSAPSPAPDGRGDNGEGGVENDDRPLAQAAKDMSEDGAKGVKEGMSAPAVDRKDVAANLVRTQAEREAYALVSRVESADEYRRGRIRTDLERIESDPNYMRFVHGGYLTSAQNAAEGMFQAQVMRDFADWRAKALADEGIREKAMPRAMQRLRRRADYEKMSQESRDYALQGYLEQQIYEDYAFGKEQPPHGIPLSTYLHPGTPTDPQGSLAKACRRLPGYDGHIAKAREEAERRWNALSPDENPEAAVRAAYDMLDDAKIAGETSLHACENKMALDAASKTGDPSITEHDGTSYTLIDGPQLAAACKGTPMGERGRAITCSKMGAVQARPAVEGEEIVTWAGDGTRESVASGKSGSYILTKLDPDGNVMLDEHGHPNEWQVAPDKMKKNYETASTSSDGSFVAKPKPAVTQVMRVDRDVVIMVPWGEGGALVPQYIRKGGYLNVTDPNDVYGISEQDFNDTYRRGDGIQHIPSLP